MSNRKKASRPAPDASKHFVGSDHAPTEQEALAMGRALFDSIAAEQAKNARR